MKFKERYGKKVRGIRRKHVNAVKPNEYILASIGYNDVLVVNWTQSRKDNIPAIVLHPPTSDRV